MNSKAQVTAGAGQPGGGKSDTLFGLSWEKHHQAIVFRQELTQMETHIIPRGNEVFSAVNSSYKGGTKRYWDHPRGRLSCGALRYPNDFMRYKGGGWTGMFFDEATDILPLEIHSVQAWNRSVRGKPCQSYMFFNPPQHPQGEWVIDHYAPWLDENHKDPAKEGEIRYFFNYDGETYELKEPKETEIDGVKIPPESRTVYFSRLAENTLLNEEYLAKLHSLPSPLKEQMLEGRFRRINLEEWFVIDKIWVEAAMDRWTPEGFKDGRKRGPMKTIGCDPARKGDAQTVLAPRHGLWYDELQKRGDTEDGFEVVKFIEEFRHPKAGVNIDVIGVGSSPYDILKNDGIPVHGINSSEGTEATDKSGLLTFKNKRAEMWWKFREALDPTSGIAIALPRDRSLLIELTTPTWKNTPHGIVIEDKRDVMKRVGHSIDSADAVIMAWYIETGKIPLTLAMGSMKI